MRLGSAKKIQIDRVYTSLEGVARYVENQYLVDASFHPDVHLLSKDPHFSGFREHEGKGYLGMWTKKLGKKYFYALGFHLGLCLDRIAPGWQEKVHLDPKGIVGVVQRVAKDKPSTKMRN